MSENVKPIQFKKPELLYKGRIVAGSLMILVLGIGLTIILASNGNLLQLGFNALSFSTLAFTGLSIGAFHVLRGVVDWVRPVAHHDGPKDFRDYDEIHLGMRRNPLTIYRDYQGLIRFLFGPLSAYLTPTQRRIFARNTEWLITKGVLIVIGIAGLIASLFQSATMGQAWTGFAAWSIFSLVFCLNVFTAKWLTPRVAPDLESDHDSAFCQGFGNPTHLYSRIPLMGQALKLGRFRNRHHVYQGPEQVTCVGDVGTFDGYLLIERQPELDMASSIPKAAPFLWIGWGLQIFGCLAACILLNASWFAAAQPGLFVLAAMVLYMFHSGHRFFQQGRDILMTLRFRSIGMVIHLKGEISRSEVAVGKGDLDSIGSTNLTTRSNFTATFQAAELISETADIYKERTLIALNQTEESRQWIDFFKERIHELQETRVTPVGVALQSKEMDEMVRANHAMFTQREQVANALASESIERDQHAIKLLSETDGDYKECPDCAESVRERARKCRFCGYEFVPLDLPN